MDSIFESNQIASSVLSLTKGTKFLTSRGSPAQHFTDYRTIISKTSEVPQRRQSESTPDKEANDLEELSSLKINDSKSDIHIDAVNNTLIVTENSYLKENPILQLGVLQASVPDSYYFDNDSMIFGDGFFDLKKSEVKSKLSLELEEKKSLTKYTQIRINCDLPYMYASDGKSNFITFYQVPRDLSSFKPNVLYKLESAGAFFIKVKSKAYTEFVIIALLQDRDGNYIQAAPLKVNGRICSFSA